jgi:peptidase M1-like protein
MLIRTGAIVLAIVGSWQFLAAPVGAQRVPRRAPPASTPARTASAPPAAASVPQAPPPQPDPAAAPPGARSPRNASYSIDARLDAASRTLTGRELITWRNISTVPAPDLRFHLYYNAWKNPRTTWMREAALGARPGIATRPEADWSWIDVTSIRLLSAGAQPFIDLTSARQYIAPDDGNAEDQTVLSVPLPRAVAPGETIRLEVGWSSKIPRTFARTGAIGNFFFIAQWFPKLGVFENGAWNCHQFHSSTEFYADYGSYDVRLTVPDGWIVGATGRQTRVTKNADATATHEYREDDVHDFVWTTSPDYVERTARFEHPGLPPVDMRLLLQPEHVSQADRHFDATRTALRYYGEWYGAYPYGHITIVDPAYQSGAGGMEYPTLFTAGTRWLAPRGVTTPESVTVHEAGHQFWYGIVGNNEFEHAWMDEGFNTFSTARAIEQAYEPNYLAIRYFGGFIPYVFRDVALSRAVDGNGLGGYRRAAEMDAPSTPTFKYWPPTASNITYGKTALWLHTIERTAGWPALQRAMSLHFERWKFKHPRPEDFFAALEEATAANPAVRQIVEGAYRGSNVFDYGIQQLTSERDAVRGLADRNGKPQAAGDADDDNRPYRTVVVVRRYGEAAVPVDVLVAFSDGERVLEHWDGRDRWKMYTYERASRASFAQVDPDRTLLMDVAYTNNSRTVTPKADAASLKWMLKYIVWVQDLLMTYASMI